VRRTQSGVAGAYRRGVVATADRPVQGPPAWLPNGARVVLLSAVIAVVQVAGSFGAQSHHGSEDFRSLDAFAVVLLLAGPLALLFRRRAPGGVLLIVMAVTLVYDVRNYPDGPVYISLVVALIAAILMGRRTLALIATVGCYVAFMWLPWLVGTKSAPSLGALLGVGAWLAVIFTFAEIVRVRRTGAMEAWRTREEEARRRASEERLRIAQELHDVLAHNISLINVQAGVALHLMDEQPEQARTALTAIRDASKDALGELRSVLDILRQSGEAPRSPTAGIADLPRLVAGAEATGLRVHLDVASPLPPLLPGVDLAAYRIVQEALTNVTRHARAGMATVRISVDSDQLVVEVTDDGLGAAAAPSSVGGGNGLPGMRERAVALGGHLDAAPVPGGGFGVRAMLPVDRPA
jgi:signal transduction histidine kinase